jgi:ribosomal protein L37AE/L43A
MSETEFFDCVICEEDVDPRRVALGYKVCLECGEELAEFERARKAECSAPAFNKGAYQYVTSLDMARDLGR